jgi:hypothetical protein
LSLGSSRLIHFRREGAGAAGIPNLVGSFEVRMVHPNLLLRDPIKASFASVSSSHEYSLLGGKAAGLYLVALLRPYNTFST